MHLCVKEICVVCPKLGAIQKQATLPYDFTGYSIFSTIQNSALSTNAYERYYIPFLSAPLNCNNA